MLTLPKLPRMHQGLSWETKTLSIVLRLFPPQVARNLSSSTSQLCLRLPNLMKLNLLSSLDLFCSKAKSRFSKTGSKTISWLSQASLVIWSSNSTLSSLCPSIWDLSLAITQKRLSRSWSKAARLIRSFLTARESTSTLTGSRSLESLYPPTQRQQ